MSDWQWPWHDTIPPDREIRRRLTHLGHTLDRLDRKLDQMSEDLNNIKTSVEAEGTVVDSAIVLLDQIAAQLEAFKNDPIEIQGIVDQINAQKDALAQAVVANTPGAPPPPPPVEQPPPAETGLTMSGGTENV